MSAPAGGALFKMSWYRIVLDEVSLAHLILSAVDKGLIDAFDGISQARELLHSSDTHIASGQY